VDKTCAHSFGGDQNRDPRVRVWCLTLRLRSLNIKYFGERFLGYLMTVSTAEIVWHQMKWEDDNE